MRAHMIRDYRAEHQEAWEAMKVGLGVAGYVAVAIAMAGGVVALLWLWLTGFGMAYASFF
jgi:hypothetical protein